MLRAKHCGGLPETCTLTQHQSRYFQHRSIPVVGYLRLLNEVVNKTASVFQANSRLQQLIEGIVHSINLSPL
jgi:hypothetical protein